MKDDRQLTTDEVLEHFTDYICENRASVPAVRRITPWLGFIVKGLEKLGATWERRGGTSRQVRFCIPGDGTTYVASYCHRTHGVKFTQWTATGATVRTFASVNDAAAFYDYPAV